jgi:hypothetical protein
VLLAALLIAAASTAICWTAGGVQSLVIARAVQGVATLDRHQWAGGRAGRLLPGETPADRDQGDGGRHECGSGRRRLGRSGSSPRRVASPVGAPVSLRPEVGAPQDSRRRFVVDVPTLMASWSGTGLLLTLTSSVVTGVLHVAQGAAGGLEITALFLAGGMGGMRSAHHTVRQATLLGAILLTVAGAGRARHRAPRPGPRGRGPREALQQHPYQPRFPMAWPPSCHDEALSSRSPSSGPLPWRGRHMRGIVAVCPPMVLRAPQLESGLCNRVTSWR